LKARCCISNNYGLSAVFGTVIELLRLNKTRKAMKTFTKLFLSVVLVIGFTTLEAQQRRLVQYKPAHVPNKVYSVTRFYPGYHWVSSSQFHGPRRSGYNVALQRGRKVVHLRVNRFGEIIGKRSYRLHPRSRNGNVSVTEYWSYGDTRPYRRFNPPLARNTGRDRQVATERYNYRRN